MKGKCQLFVYGTLRKGGPANHLLKDSRLNAQGVRLHGYKMFNAGLYPIVVPADLYSFIQGDLYEVDSRLLADLDVFEGDGYTKREDPNTGYIVYVAATDATLLPEVGEGDWLSYARENNIVFPSW
jgi:gamma-glutamylcyclotransferase (GGCT)/AIG2-like uncharacterized protein YtfP